MRAIDTNILVRLIARDDDRQRDIARANLVEGGILLLPTVILECEWVLRSRYHMSRRGIVDGLLAIVGLELVNTVSRSAIVAALDAYAYAGDFGDLLHASLAIEAGATSIVTFDRDFAAPARALRSRSSDPFPHPHPLAKGSRIAPSLAGAAMSLPAP